MVTQAEAEKLWTQFAIVLPISLICYTLIYYYAFNRQLNRNRNSIKIAHEPIKVVDSNKLNVDRAQHSYGSTQSTDKRIYSPENCLKYASCVISMFNCIILTIGGPLAFIYHQYWKDPIYGTPGISFFVLALFFSYLVVDMLAGIIIYFKYKLKKLLWDVILHHILFISAFLWMEIPRPQYAWHIVVMAYVMEVSTIFLDLNFLAKWYKLSEAVIWKCKLGFLFSWFLVRVPVTFGLVPAYLIYYGPDLYRSYPLDKFVGAILLCSANLVMQSIWTVLIAKKAYRSITATDTVAKVDNFDLTVQDQEEKV